MKLSINKDAINKLKYQLKLKFRSAYQLLKAYYQKLNKRQRIALSVVGGLILLLLLVVSLSLGSDTVKKSTPKQSYPVRFETQPKHSVNTSAIPARVNVGNNARLQTQLNQLKAASSEQYNTVKNQLQAIQSSMSSLASLQDVAQLKQTVAEPNERLLGKMNSLQNSVKKIVKQTEKKTWVEPQSVERYFRLVAVQGFSDGMRANVVKALIPVQAYAWLHRNSSLFSVWQRYLQGDIENNVFAELTEKKKENYLSAELQKEKIKESNKLDELQVYKTTIHNINNKEIINTEFKVVNNQPESKVTTTETDVNSESISSIDNKTCEIKEINFNEESKPSGEKESMDQKAQELKKADQNSFPLFSDQDFWHWLKQSINKKTVSWNQGNSFIHGVELGVLIQIPQAIDAFLTSQAKKHNVESEVLMKQQRASLTIGIKKYDKLIKNTRGSRINVYCIGKWEDRKTLSGVVVEKDFLTNNIQTISINPQLTPDPLEVV